MTWLPDILAALIAIAGWFYLFYSPAARKLEAIEEPRANQGRIRLRRLNGLVLLLLAACLYAGFHTVDQDRPTLAFLLVWLAVLVLLLVTMALGVADLRLTLRLRQTRRQDQKRD